MKKPVKLVKGAEAHVKKAAENAAKQQANLDKVVPVTGSVGDILPAAGNSSCEPSGKQVHRRSRRAKRPQ